MSERLLERFLRYVKVDTTAGEPGPVYPSSPGQKVLGAILADELRAMGAESVEHDSYGLVYALVPATVNHKAPTIAWNSHMDTSPETTGKDVEPQVIRNYGGGDIVLPGDPSKVIRESANPELAALRGKTLVTTDGTTLLGADDKAGVAAIMEATQRLIEDKSIPHGPIRVVFTCDEEVGHGVDFVDLKKLNATCAYTLDGGGTGEIDVETFSADQAVVTIHGVNIHPSIGKGRMVNAIRAASHFVDLLPRTTLSPETTDGREGFLHPYTIDGGVDRVTIKILLRDFDTSNLAKHAEVLDRAARDTEQTIPGCRIVVDVQKQYRNMADGLLIEPRAVAFAEEALRRLGRPFKRSIVRGGTDGSRFTELGLPTPNLSTGEHNPHSPLEWTCLEEMEAAVLHLVELAKVWGEVKE